MNNGNGYRWQEVDTFYVAGPMSWLKAFNFPAFDEACGILRDFEGKHFVSPAELDDPHEREEALLSPFGAPTENKSKDWTDFLRRDLRIVTNVQGIVCLPGFTASSGADLETFVARSLRMPHFMFPRLDWVQYACPGTLRDSFASTCSAWGVPVPAHAAGGWLECAECGDKMVVWNEGEVTAAMEVRRKQVANREAAKAQREKANVALAAGILGDRELNQRINSIS